MVDYEKAAELLIDKCDKLRERIKELEAEKIGWEKQKCGKGFAGEGVTCDDRRADIGHYVTHYKRAKQIITKQAERITELEGKIQEVANQLIELYTDCNETAEPEVYGSILGLHQRLEQFLKG